MWTFWPAVVTAFLAAFSVGHKQIRRGCNTDAGAHGLICRTTENLNAKEPLDLDTFRATREKTLNATLIKGAAIEDFQWREGTTKHPFTIGIVEYDDQGMTWSDAQVERVRELVSVTVKNDDALIVTFVHGWKNDCETCNGNLACFREVLALLAAVEADLARLSGQPVRRVVGVYVAWRGKTMKIPYADTISAFSRKAAADRVGGRASDLTSFLGWLNEARLRANRATTRPAHPSPFGTRLVLVGHSFGADVLFGVIAGHLSAQLGASTATGAALHAEPFANATVLVNPALEASLYERFNKQARVLFTERQLPLIVTVQGINDQVTRTVFPVERALVTIGDATSTAKGYRSSLTAIGHSADYFTHTLVLPSPAMPEMAAPEVPENPAPARCACGPLLATAVAHQRLLESVNAALMQMNTDVHIGGAMKALYSDLEPSPGTNIDSPLMVVRARPEVVDGHSGIYSRPFFDFLANFVVKEQLLEGTPAERQQFKGVMQRAATERRP